MTKFSVDYNSLDQNLNKKKFYRLADVQDRITKVAFDIVRFVDGDHTIDNLWRIENTPDGQVIVSMYDESKAPDKIEITASKKETDWNAIPDKTASYMTVFYKNEPLKKVAFSELGVEKSDAAAFCNHLSNKLSQNKALINSLLKSIAKEEKEYLLAKYPELNG